MTANKAGGRGRAALSKSVMVKVVTSNDPKEPYKLKWKKHFLGIPYWGEPPIDSDADSNLILNFTIENSGSKKVGFATPVTAAFGANAGAGGCPSAGSDAGGEISFENSSGTSSDLSIFDVNKNAGDIQFAVFFDNGEKLDPIIKNTGGGSTPPINN